MQIIPPEPANCKATKDSRVRISTNELTNQEIESIRQFLEKDPQVESVVVGPLATFIEPPKDGPSTAADHDGSLFLTIEIHAAAEAGALIINFLKDNKDAIGAGASLATPVVLGCKYVLEKVTEYSKKRDSKITKIPIYDPKGNVIKWAKRKNS
jgi:hypothetical protein